MKTVLVLVLVVLVISSEVTAAKSGVARRPGQSDPVDIRLVGGSSSSEGRVEVYHDGQWGTVCDDYFGMNEANVVCRQLGYGGATEVRPEAAFGAGSGPIWLDNLACEGSETSIEHCSHLGWGTHVCHHGEDVGVVCSDEPAAMSAQDLAALRVLWARRLADLRETARADLRQ
ncbi:macrophage scavenger receptor types I and II-like [Branchiostoma floridae x Branchiostoma japonicum]